MAAARRDEDDSDGAIHKMDTVPPPAGEDDAYNAATKVGPMARSMVEAMMASAVASENSSLPPPASFTRGVKLPKPARLPALEVTPDERAIEKLDDDMDEGDRFEPTALVAVAEPVRAAPASASAPAPAPATPSAAPSAPVATPATPLAPPSTRRSEIAVFFATFGALSLVALIVYLVWLR